MLITFSGIFSEEFRGGDPHYPAGDFNKLSTLKTPSAQMHISKKIPHCQCKLVKIPLVVNLNLTKAV
jgi:hypothetical protein